VVLFALALAPFRRCLDVANNLEKTTGRAASALAAGGLEQPRPARL